MIIRKETLESIKDHFRAKFPEEACGFIKDDTFYPVRNIAADPAVHREENCNCRLCSFIVHTDDSAKHLDADMFVHSHPLGNMYPSAADMECQINSDMPWAIISLNADRISEPVIWGDQLPIRPVIGRQFMHGVSDCYSLVRDCFRLGKTELLKQGVEDWPFDPIDLPDVPRDDSWWSKGYDLYEDGIRNYGFVEIHREEARPGDGFLGRINSETVNHAGLLIGQGLIIHHLPQRLSRREPAGLWARNAAKWVRYVGKGSIYA